MCLQWWRRNLEQARASCQLAASQEHKLLSLPAVPHGRHAEKGQRTGVGPLQQGQRSSAQGAEGAEGHT